MMDALFQRLISFYALSLACELLVDGSLAAQIDFLELSKDRLLLLSPFEEGLKSWRCYRIEYYYDSSCF